MEQKHHDTPAMRVSIVSVSRNQREHLKHLIEQHGQGPRVVGMSGFRDYDLTHDEPRPDVLLVDLDQADDVSLTRIEKLLEQSNIPVLFNESTAVPTTPGPYRDDWVDNLVGKLYNLATRRRLLAKSGLSDRPRYAQTVSHTLPNVLIVAHSKTRRRVLQIILAAQGIRDSTEISFAPNFIAERIGHYDALLVDEHNLSPDEQEVLSELTTQTSVPVQVCNSSTIPYAALDRRKWGIQLAAKIIGISKPKALSLPAPSPTQLFTELNGEFEWGHRLSEVLDNERTNLTLASAAKDRILAVTIAAPSASAFTTPAPRIIDGSSDIDTSLEQPSLTSDTSIVTQLEIRLAESKHNDATGTLGVIAAHQGVKDSHPINSNPVVNSVPEPLVTETASTPEHADAKPASSTNHARAVTPIRAKTPPPVFDIIDATNLDSLPVTQPPNLRDRMPLPEPLPADARDNEIERFFDFDKELDISQSRHALGAGHILNSATHDEVLPWNIEEEPTNPFSNHPNNKHTSGWTQKKQRSSWRDSLKGIRQKLPKLFH